MVEYSQLRVSFKMLGTEGGAKLTKLLTVSISGSALSKFGSQHLQTDSPTPLSPGTLPLGVPAGGVGSTFRCTGAVGELTRELKCRGSGW